MRQLTKWYLDLVSDDGTALVVYVATLRWGPVSVDYAATLLARPGEALEETTSFSHVHLPSYEPGEVRLEQPSLGVQGRWGDGSAPVSATLLEVPSGTVRWECLLPSAHAWVALRGEKLEGRGYVERLTMTAPPWALPLRTLRWGRYASAGHAVVWIEWRGGPPKQWVWMDGEPQRHACLEATGITGLSHGRRLTLSDFRELCDRRALQVLSRRLPSLARVPLGPLRNLRETKRLDQGVLATPGADPDQGWALHEVVTW